MKIRTEKYAIRLAWMFGLLTISTTLISLLFVLNNEGSSMVLRDENLKLIDFTDIGILVILTIGIYFKSRLCALTMLLYFLTARHTMWQDDFSIISVLIAAVFIAVFVLGVCGIVSYHARQETKSLLIRNISSSIRNKFTEAIQRTKF